MDQNQSVKRHRWMLRRHTQARRTRQGQMRMQSARASLCPRCIAWRVLSAARPLCTRRLSTLGLSQRLTERMINRRTQRCSKLWAAGIFCFAYTNPSRSIGIPWWILLHFRRGNRTGLISGLRIWKHLERRETSSCDCSRNLTSPLSKW